jgi:mRNA interferase MazF
MSVMASVDELWLVDFGDPHPGEPAHHSPALIIGPAEVFGRDFPFVMVCPVTTRHRGLSLHIEIEPGERSGLDELSYVQCELLRSISRRRLVHRIGEAEPEASVEVHRIIATLLGH